MTTINDVVDDVTAADYLVQHSAKGYMNESEVKEFMGKMSELVQREKKIVLDIMRRRFVPVGR